MSNAIIDALAREEGKLVRQIANRDATLAVIDVLGDSAKEQSKLGRQNQAIADTETNIAKLSKAVRSIKK